MRLTRLSPPAYLATRPFLGLWILRAFLTKNRYHMGRVTIKCTIILNLWAPRIFSSTAMSTQQRRQEPASLSSPSRSSGSVLTAKDKRSTSWYNEVFDLQESRGPRSNTEDHVLGSQYNKKRALD